MSEDIYEELKPIFDPEGIAVVGASRKEGKIGNSVYKNLKESAKTQVYPINPKAEAVDEDKAYDSLKELPCEVDVVVVTVPAKVVPQIMRESGEAGVKGAVIITSGFSEIGEKELEETIKDIARKNNIRVIGPNCLGVMDNITGLDTLFLPSEKLGTPKKGKVGIISQSGAVGSVIVDWAAAENYGVSRFISYGNGIDLDERHLIKFLGQDPETEVIAIYLEGTKNGRELMKAAREVTPEKPIIVLKAGKTGRGSKAVSSHTGSLAGSIEVYRAAFKETGIIEARNMLDLMDYAEAFEKQPLPSGRKVMIITNGGGFGVLSTDEVIFQGLQLAELSSSMKEKLDEIMPDYGEPNNPLDLVGDAGPDSFERALDIVKCEDDVDAVICIELFQTVPMGEGAVDAALKFNEDSDKPIIVCTAGGELVRRMKKKLEDGGIPVFNTPHRAVDALTSLVDYSEFKSRKQD